MPLSKHNIDTNTKSYAFDADRLSAEIRRQLPEVLFAYLHGSAAKTQMVKAHSDIDIALYIDDSSKRGADSFLVYSVIQEICSEVVGPVRCDVGFIKGAEPVFRFEVLRGRLLFTRDQEKWLRFYSVTCREYEHQMFHYEKQRRYRLEAACAG